ncbi:MAG: hypothetical protein H7Y01_10060 [Ferruginibacter sp.]|nr:hypothetical protein [Chitinophagaceae bacterium]
MKFKSNISLRQRIYWSFSFLVFLFIVNGFITILTINSNKRLSTHLSEVIEPSLGTLDHFKKLMLESKMYSTNWVFLRFNQEDKVLLEKLHGIDYPALKAKLIAHTKEWVNNNWVDSVHKVYDGFEELLAIEKNIMRSLQTFDDYDDPVIKLEAERKLEEEVLPRTTTLLNALDAIYKFGAGIRTIENAHLEKLSVKLRLFIILLAVTICCAGLFLARYMTRVIIAPIQKIRLIVNDLGKGIIRTLDHRQKKDEIGDMVLSVNNLSRKLSATAAFASEIGNRNFKTWYEPLSQEDTLGLALIAMRDNLRINETTLDMNTKELERKNRELEQFVYIASHDLQEPLRTTSSFVDLLQKQYQGKLDTKADKYLTYIAESSERMKILINDLMDYSRIGTKKEMEEVDCNIIVQEVIADLGQTIKESQALIHVEHLPLIGAYRTEIKQLFQNLVVNAIKFAKKDTTPLVSISFSQDNTNWIFAIRDNGIGIAEDHRERIFIIFQRLHNRNQYEGSGIGLAHCKKIAGLHHGKIWVESATGEGSTFYFSIPKNNTWERNKLSGIHNNGYTRTKAMNYVQ